MAKKSNKHEASTYRLIGVRTDNNNYHIDFKTKDEALNHIDKLNDPKLEWYGLYEVIPSLDTLKSVVWKRLIPFKTNTPIVKEDNTVKKTRKRQQKTL